jgi:hypothetical protein
MVIAGGCLASSGLAAEYGNQGQNAIVKAIIRQIPRYHSARTPDDNIRAQSVFDVVGSLNAIEDNQITIGNRQLTLGSTVSASGIAMWTEVGAKLNQAGEVVVLEIVSDEPH